MGPYESANSGCGSNSSGSLSSSLGKAANDIDWLLTGAGYKVCSSDLRHVAQHLEHLETAMAINAPDNDISQLASDGVHYNPSDARW